MKEEYRQELVSLFGYTFQVLFKCGEVKRIRLEDGFELDQEEVHILLDKAINHLNNNRS